MRQATELAAGLALLIALALAGDAAVAHVGGGVPGPVLGLAAYLVLLFSGRGGWTLPAARLLVRWLGALIVPALVGIALFGGAVAKAALPLLLVLAAASALTGLGTALLFRAAGGRR